MKKHPVDDLFKSKLSELEKQPSNAAWLRIQNEQKNTKQRLGGWVWYAAASVAIAIISGYLVWQGKQENFRNEVDQSTVAVITESTKIGKSTDLDSLVKQDDDIVQKTEELQIAVADIKTNKSEIRKPIHIKPAGQPDSQKTELQNNAINITQETNSIAGTGLKNIPVSVSEPVVLPHIEKEVASESVLTVAEKKENRTIVINVDTQEENLDEKPKPSRFSKVFRQLKNARAGDPVDWKEVGFNPKVIIARVDERVRNKEEVILEKYQNIKERTKL